MAVPKRKKSRSNTRHRRAQWKTQAVQTQPCPQCREPRLSHQICQNCGTYNGRTLLEV